MHCHLVVIKRHGGPLHFCSRLRIVKTDLSQGKNVNDPLFKWNSSFLKFTFFIFINKFTNPNLSLTRIKSVKWTKSYTSPWQIHHLVFTEHFLMPWLGIFSLLWVSPGRVFWFWKPSPSLSIMSWKKNNCRIFLCCFFCKLQLMTFPREDFFSKEVKISKIYSSTWKQQFWRKLVTKFSPQKCCGLLYYFFLSMKNTLKRRSIGL